MRKVRPMRHWQGFVLQVVVLFAFWSVLSDQRRPLFFAMGLVTALVVSLLTNRIVATVLTGPSGSVGDRLARSWWFVVFAVWVLWKIVGASVQVAYFAIHPGLPFRPGFVRFETAMQRPLSRVVLATAITIVPGTMTVRLDGSTYLVHALLPDAFDDLRDARMQNMIGRFLGEAPENPPHITWEPIPEAVR
jgi:multicomponent Na+:H+ antiporter subunit E